MLHREFAAGIIVGIALCSNVARAETRLGVELGANVSSYSFKPAPASLEGRTGVLAGGFLEFALSEVFVLQPGLRYNQKGFAFEGYRQTEHFVEAPVMVKARIRASEKVKPYFIAGPDLGYSFATYFDPLIGAVFLTDFDLAFDFGAGVEFVLSPKLNFFLQGRYSLGLINVVEADNTPAASGKSRGVQLSAGLSLAL